MQRSTVELVPTVDIYLLSEINNWQQHVSLCCQMDRIETRFSCKLIVSLMLLYKIFNDI